MNAEFLDRVRSIVGERWVVTDRDAMTDYLKDETVRAVRPAPANDVLVVKPNSTREIAALVELANEQRVPIYPRGGGTGLVGGAIPTTDGLVLSMERLDRVLEVDPENLMITVEAGVTLETIIERTAAAGLFFPLHPGEECAQIGGMVACNAGGARAVKYGIMRNYVKGLEIVLATGTTLTLGGKLLKDVAGYDLLHLMIGSGGTLGVITKVTLRCHPRPGTTVTLVIPFDERSAAFRSVPLIIRGGIVPLAIEFVEHRGMARAAQQLGLSWPVARGSVALLVILDGDSESDLIASAARIDEITAGKSRLDILVALDRTQQQELLKLRSHLLYSYADSLLDTLDIAVPPGSIGELTDELDRVADRYGMTLPIFGHAGDGNLHPCILSKAGGGIDRGDLDRVKSEIYDITTALGGTICAEHGIGKIRLGALERAADPTALALMRAIKCAFDPNGILNPRAIVDTDTKE